MVLPALQNTSSSDIYLVVLVIQNQAKVQSLTNFMSLRDLKTGRHSWWFFGGGGIELSLVRVLNLLSGHLGSVTYLTE